MNEVLVETLIDTMSNNEKETREVKELIKALPDHRLALEFLNTRMEGIGKAVEDLPNRISMPVMEIVALQQQLQEHSRKLAIPLKKEVRHEHHMSKPLRWYIALSLVILGLLFLLYHTWNTASQHEENDIKYRYMQVFLDAKGKRYLHNLDSLYNLNPGPFRKNVINQEEHNKEQLEKLQRLEERREGVKELERETQGPSIEPSKKARPDRTGRQP